MMMAARIMDLIFVNAISSRESNSKLDFICLNSVITFSKKPLAHAGVKATSAKKTYMKQACLPSEGRVK